MTAQTTDTHERLHAVLKGFDSAMLVTMEPSGEHRARPMAVAELSDTAVCFITSIVSEKVEEIALNPEVCVAFQKGMTYASLSGRARISRDRARIEALWSPSWKTWFPDGKEDPDIALIDVDPTAGEYWDTSGAKGIKYAWNAAKALFQGDTPRVDKDQHAQVAL